LNCAYAEDLWFLMQQSDDPLRRGMALTCYCDDSGTHKESKAAVVGGIVLTKDKFIKFCGAWGAILREFRIDKIHMADFVRPNGRYSAMRPEMKVALFTAVAKTILEFKIYSMSSAVPQGEYSALLPKEVAREFIGPYAMAFLVLMTVNITIGLETGYIDRLAYLIDKGSKRHHEQLQGAHTLLLHVEKGWNRTFTGAIASDIDDHNSALQAADVIAWTHHRTVDSQEFGDDFRPLLPLMEQLVRVSPEKNTFHCKVDLPEEGLKLWSGLMNSWIKNEGALPSWPEILKSPNSKNLTW